MSVTLRPSSAFPPGTVVAAYPESNWPAHLRPPSGPPVGAAAETDTVAADGSLTFADLTEDPPTRYIAHAEVGGVDRYVSFKAGSDVSGVAHTVSLFVDATGQAAPTGLTATPVGSGGTLAARSMPLGHYYTVTATGPDGESVGRVTNAVAFTGANDSVTLEWDAAPGATGYKVYRDSAFTYSTGDVTPQLVATLGNVTTYLDTGTATTATSPPATNGGAETVNLPAVGDFAGSLYIVKAVGNTENLVTLSPDGAETVDGAASVALGQGEGADYRSVVLAPDGTDWRVVGAEVAFGHAQASELEQITCAAGEDTALAVVQLPRVLGEGERMRITATTQVRANTGVTELVPSLNACDAAGAFVDTPPGPNPNIGFWADANFAVGDWRMLTVAWNYDPRPGDVNLESTAAPPFIGFHINPTGGTCDCVSTNLYVTYGAIPLAYWEP